MAKKPKTARQLRGQLMLQTSAGRFFRPGVELHESPHRRTVYSNAWIPDRTGVELPVGTITCSTEFEPISTATLEAVDRLEKTRWDGTDDFVVATGGDELIDDLAYVMTFALNRTFSRNHDLVHRLVPPEGATGRRGGAASLFPHLLASAVGGGYETPSTPGGVRQFARPSGPNVNVACVCGGGSGKHGPDVALASTTGPRSPCPQHLALLLNSVGTGFPSSR